MNILLVRHGQAVDEAPGLGDEGRWLTPRGRKLTRKVARWLDKNDKRRPTAIWTSPLVRAVQTAEILALGVGLEGEVKSSAELRPGRDPGDLVKRLTDERIDGVLALVGHEPTLSLIAAALLGDTHVDAIKKSGIVSLTWADGKGTLRFVLDPSRMKAKKRFEAKVEEAAKEAAATEDA